MSSPMLSVGPHRHPLCMTSSVLDSQPRPAGNRSGAARAVTPTQRARAAPVTHRPARDDADAFLRSLYAEHSASLRAHVGRILSDPHQAEDVVQETMLRAWRNVDTLSAERGRIGGWLCTVARNIAIDRIRAKRARPTEVDEAHTDAATWSVTDHADLAVNSVFVARALAMLSPCHRAVLREVYFKDRTCSEAAKVLGIPEGTVKSRLYYALRRLRLAIEEERR